MGEAIDMFNPSRRVGGGVSNHRLFQAIRSDETAELCSSSIGELIRVSDFEIPPLEARVVEPPKEAGSQGSCYVFKPNSPDDDLSLLVIDANFPNYLIENGVDYDSSVAVAAVYARSLEFLTRVFARSRTWHRGESRALQRIANAKSVDSYWHEQLLRTRLRTQFRAAGTVALHATGLDFDTSDKPPYAPHIAGLMDPISTDKSVGGSFLELQEIITASTR